VSILTISSLASCPVSTDNRRSFHDDDSVLAGRGTITYCRVKLQEINGDRLTLSVPAPTAPLVNRKQIDSQTGSLSADCVYCATPCCFKENRWRNIEESSCNHCCSGRARSTTYSECVFVALVIQQAMRVRHIVSSSANSFVLQHISTLSQKRHDFFRKPFLNKMCFHFLYNFRPNYLFLWRIQWDIIKMYRCHHVRGLEL